MDRKANELSFIGHLEELRTRIIKALAFVFIVSCFFYRFVPQVIRALIQPVGHLVFLSPSEAFTAHITVTLLGGIIFSSPYIVYQIWRFIASALTEVESKYIRIFGALSLVFFLLGVGFAYKVILPISLRFFLSFASEQLIPQITVQEYISFVGWLCLAFGVVFESPLLMIFLTQMGIATPAFLVQKRRHIIVGIFIFSAIFTPPDYVSQLLMAIPLVILYEVSIVFAKITYRWAHRADTFSKT